MSGALAERVFATKLANVGFDGLRILERRPFGLRDAARYPLFTPDLIDLMGDLLPPERHDEVAVSVTLTASKPPTDGSPPRRSSTRRRSTHLGPTRQPSTRQPPARQPEEHR